MNPTKLARIALCVAALGLTLSGALGGASAGAAGPKLVVTPSTNLHNGEKVKVSGSGFKPGDTVYIVECLVKAKGESGCTISNLVVVTITKSGDLPRSTFKVASGKIGSGKQMCGTKTSNLKSCAVSAGNESGGDSAVFPIAFKAPAKK
ncbi:MAG: neocarzinostatin apoprotein domain-containing protein [Acidimicrobiales bacterium]